MTHWPPTKQAIAPRFADSPLNGYFANDYEGLIEIVGAQLWISGHVHDAYEVVIGDTQVVGNPTGYPREAVESRLFRPDRVVEV